MDGPSDGPGRRRARRDEYAEFYRMQTRWMDCDIYGHVNNVVHYSLFDTAVNGWLIENGLLDPHGGESYGLVVETGCRYHAEMRFPARVAAGIRVGRLGNSSVRYEIGLFADDEDLAVAEGFFVHVHVARLTHRPVRISGRLRAMLAQLMR